MKRYIITGLVLLLIMAGVTLLHPARPQYESTDNTEDSYEYYYNENEEDEEDSLLPEDLNSILADNPTVPLDLIPSSITVLVNRLYPLPSNYIPSSLVVPDVKFNFAYLSDKRKMRKVAADALERLFEAGEKKGIELYGVSGYRSYARQKEIYDRNIASRGQSATDAVSAKPGSSEHQTGLTIDVSAKSVNFRLDQSFGDTKEGKWLAQNAHLYGFIIRYPYGKSAITGYSYEPWHIRFVGKTVATYLYESKLTLEEYYGVEAAADEPDNAVDVEDPDTVKYATPKPTKKPTPAPKPEATKKPASTKKPKQTRKPKPEKTRSPGKATAKPAAKTPKPVQEEKTPVPTPVPPAPTAPPASTPVPEEPKNNEDPPSDAGGPNRKEEHS